MGPTVTEPGRTRLRDPAEARAADTAALVEALAGRLATLRVVSGEAAIGSMTAGYAALGRRVARTADGARLRRALAATRAAANGADLWQALGIDRLAARSAATPVLDDLRADVALLLADDLSDALEDRPALPPPPRLDFPDEPAEFVDYLVGMWAFASEAVRAIEVLALAAPQPQVVDAPDGPGEPGPRLLR